MTEAIYQQILLDLARAAAGDHLVPSPPAASTTLDNPLCGDRITLAVRLERGRIAAFGHKVRGCILCEAAAGLLAARAPGAAPTALLEAGDRFASMLKSDEPVAWEKGWEAAEAFLPVRSRKSRHDCALLPFRALRRLLEDVE